jgi:hypothetical protein
MQQHIAERGDVDRPNRFRGPVHTAIRDADFGAESPMRALFGDLDCVVKGAIGEVCNVLGGGEWTVAPDRPLFT